MKEKAKNKAKELIKKFQVTEWDERSCDFWENKELTKKYALICVGEIIEAYDKANVEYEDGVYILYWQEVKKEIENYGKEV